MSALGYSFKENAGRGSLVFRFDACTREPASWKEEVYAAARMIADKAKGKPLWVCSSGGIDSEIACRAFFDQGIHFSVLTLEHEGGTNQHDIRFAVDWCRKRGVKHKIVKIDMPAFLTQDTGRYMERYPAYHPFRYIQIRLMELVEEMGGYAVLGGGEQVYNVDAKKASLTHDDVYLLLTTGNIAPLEWLKNTNVEHEPYFYFSTPEVCLSFMRIPLVSFMLSNPDPILRHKVNTYILKKIVFLSYWPDITTRVKSTGLERIASLVDATSRRMKEHFGEQLRLCHLPIPVFERQLTGRI